MPLIETTYKLTLGEFVQTSMVTMRRSRFVQGFGLIVGAVGLVALFAGGPLDAAPGLLFAFVALTGLFSVPFTLFVAWRYRERVFPVTTISVDVLGVQYRMASAQINLDWALFNRLSESDGFLWLEFGPQTLPIPIRIFTPAELATIRRLAAKAGFGPDGRPRGRPGRAPKGEPGS